MTRDEIAALGARKRWTVMEGRAVMRAMQATGASVAAFAAEHGLHVERLRRWRKRVGKGAVVRSGGTPKTLRIPVVPVAVVGGAAVKFEVVIGDVVVRVPAGFDEAALRRLLVVVAAC